MSTNLVKPSKISNTRRSQRLLLKIAVVVGGQRPSGSNFAEETSTEIINAHGALLLLAEPVRTEQHLRIRNTKSGEEESCKVVSKGQKSDGKTEVGIEFLRPAPRFWRVAFPPEDWNLNSPEAKRPGKNPVNGNRETANQGSSEKR